MYYVLLFCLKACLGITSKCDPILIGVFFLIQSDKFKGESEIWLRVDWEKEPTHGLSWEQALFFYIEREQISICLIPIGLGLFKTAYYSVWCKTTSHKIFTFSTASPSKVSWQYGHHACQLHITMKCYNALCFNKLFLEFEKYRKKEQRRTVWFMFQCSPGFKIHSFLQVMQDFQNPVQQM